MTPEEEQEEKELKKFHEAYMAIAKAIVEGFQEGIKEARAGE